MEVVKGGGASSIDNEMRRDSRRIEFHLARKPFSGINSFDYSNSSSGFKIETLNPTVNASNGYLNYLSNESNVLKGIQLSTETNKKYDLLDHDHSLGITFRRIGAGLENLGNTCFLNSVLQCLTYTEPLAAYLQSGKHQNSCHVAGFCALCAIQKHVIRALQSTGRILAPKDLVSNLRCISRNFRNSRQEDAHEYMINLLESMHKCCLPSGVPSEAPSAYEKSLVHKIFGGQLQSQVKCIQCSHCSSKFDPFLDLSLEIAKADSLHKALAHFTSAEQLDGGERQYQCQQCKQKVKALKQLTVHKAPCVLAIHLKRFCAHDPGKKIDKKVSFGSTLDLKPFFSGPCEGDLKYSLYGVLVHAGWSTRSGHYYCFVRTSSGIWHSLDDNRVVQVSERIVLEQKAYMLFYFRERQDGALKKPYPVCVENKNLNAMENRMSVANKISLELPNPPNSGSLSTALKSSTSQSQMVEKALPKNSSNVKTVVGGLQSEGTGAVSSNRQTIYADPEVPIAGFKQSPVSSIASSSSVSVGTKLNRKSKKKLVKPPIASIHLGANIMFRSLSLFQRKKHTKNSGISNSECVKEIDLGPSTSDLTSAPAVGSSLTGRKRVKPCKEKRSHDVRESNDDPQLHVKDEGSTKKTSQNDAMVATDNFSEKSSNVKAGDSESRAEASTRTQGVTTHKSLTSLLTGGRGVSGTSDPHWNGIESASYQSIESRVVANVKLGYVADEWDAEYDRGKRKKVRLAKETFDGSNPFQELATMKAQRQKAKTDRSRSDNRPFRVR